MSKVIELRCFNKTFKIRLVYILLALIAIASFIRFYRLTYVSLWLDEIYSMIGSDPKTTVSDVYEYSKADQPPVFFFALHFWLQWFGYTDFAGRAIACTYGVLGVIAIFFLGKEVKDEKLGLLTAFLTTINWFHTDISKEIRFYPLVFLLTTLSYLFFIRAIKRKKIIDFLFYTLCAGLLLNTHYFGMVVFVTQFLIFILVLVFFERSWKLLVSGLVAGVLAGLSFYHWLPVINHDLQIEQFHVSPVTWDLPFSFAWGYTKEPVSLTIYVISAILTTIHLIKIISARKVRVTHAVVFGWALIGFLIPLIYSIVRMPLLTEKYNTIAVPVIFLAVAFGFTKIPNVNIKSGAIIAITISSIIILFFARPPYRPRRAEDWREVAAYFADHHLGNETIFSQLAWFDQYYFKKLELTPPQDQNVVNVVDLIRNKNEIWLFVNERYTGGWPTIGFLDNQKQIVAEQFEVADTVEFKLTKAYKYVRKK